MFALIQGDWINSYTGTGMFFPTNAVLYESETDAYEALNKAAKKFGVDWCVVPVSTKIDLTKIK